MLIKKIKQDLDSLFVNKGISTDNILQRRNNTLPDIALVDIETWNYTLAEASTKSDSNRFNDLKGEVSNNTANLSAFMCFVLDELHKIKDKLYNFGREKPDGSGLVENLKEEVKFLREEISSKSLIIKILA